LETGDAAVDRQHRAIHRLFNELQSSADNDAAIMRTLDFLTEHVLVHFATEEALMSSTEFPPRLAESHIAEHRLLVDGVRDHVLAFRTGELRSIDPIVAFLHEWLIAHVHQCDRQLIDHVRAWGVVAQIPDAWLALEQRTSA
jgi:hemerythrin-like metal-binding protein